MGREIHSKSYIQNKCNIDMRRHIKIQAAKLLLVCRQTTESVTLKSDFFLYKQDETLFKMGKYYSLTKN